MKYENNWHYKTIASLEKVDWAHLNSETQLIRRIAELRKIPLNEFTAEDLRLLIGQQIGLDYTIPFALRVLTNDLFAEGDLYPGDLLQNILQLPYHIWNERKQYWQMLNDLIKGRLKELEEFKIETNEFYKTSEQQ